MMSQGLTDLEAATGATITPAPGSPTTEQFSQSVTDLAGALGSANTCVQSWFSSRLQARGWTFYVQQNDAEPTEDKGEAAEMGAWMERSRRARRNWLRENS